MPNPNPIQNEEFKSKQFRVEGDEPLAKVRGIRLPQSVDVAIEALPAKERATWLRRVICEAAQRELMNN